MAVGDVIRWESRRGRNLEFDEVEAGTATIYLNNRHGKYDPTFGGSPYSGKLLPLKQTRITARRPDVPNTWIPQFTGYVEEWDYERRGPRHGIAIARLADAFEPLARTDLTHSMTGGTYFAAQQTDDRQRAILADVGFPAPRTQINTGNVDVQPIVYDPGTSALEALRDASEAEFPGVGLMFIKKDGTYRFLGRCARFDKTSPDWRLGDAPARAINPALIPIRDVRWRYEREHVYNAVTILPAGAEANASSEVRSASSIALRGRRSLSLTDILIQAGTTTGKTAVAECHDVFAQYYVDNYKQPYVRPYGLTLSASFMEAGNASYLGPLWDFMLNVEIGDLLELNTVHPGGGGINALLYFVEGISNVVEPPYKWRQTIDLSPKGRFTGAAYLGC